MTLWNWTKLIEQRLTYFLTFLKLGESNIVLEITNCGYFGPETDNQKNEPMQSKSETIQKLEPH